MDYVIHSGGLPFNGETLKTQALGGSESAAYYLARELARRGHDVKLFTAHQQGGTWDGVDYVPAGELSEQNPLGRDFTFYAANTPHDVLLIQRHPLAFHKDYASKINVWQLHDLALHRSAPMIQGGLPRVDAVTCVSQWHADQVREVWGIQPPTLRVVPNGVDPAVYAGVAGALPEIPGKDYRGTFPMLYQSRPERGMERLVRPGGIMSRLAEAGSKAHLFICHYGGAVPQMVGFYNQLYAWAHDLPNVTLLGQLTKPDLARLQRACALLCYATEFEEVSCITAMEAMHAGLPILTSAVGALPETCEGAGALLLPLTAEGKADEEKFAGSVLSFEAMPELLADLRTKQLAAAATRTWERAADAFEAVVADAFKARQKSDAAVLRHLIEHSDIVAAEQYGPATGGDAIASASRGELRSMYAFSREGGDILGHYEKWEGQYLAKRAQEQRSAEFEVQTFMASTRGRGLATLLAPTYNAFIAKPTNKGRRMRVLEYGCAHGHVTCAMARMLPAVDFVGADFMAVSIDTATASAAELGLKNVTFELCDQTALAAREDEFDVVIAAEVLEHVRDYRALLDALRDRLADDGALLLTTPTGRWEWVGHATWSKGREHLHHFEKQDLREIFAGHQTEFLFAPAGADECGESLGSWLTAVRFDHELPLGTIDYERKLRELAPRQTLSLCMIVKDAQDSIRKAMSGAIKYADEVVVAIDSDSTDRTRERIEELAAEWPFKPFLILGGVSAMAEGFAAARNRTIDAACGDWIMWMDADEELSGGGNMWRVLRPSNFNAYGTPQLHYSSEPPQVLTTDYPCRLFRNYRGVRFYGLVHEHPEDKPGDAIAQSAMLSDVKFLHGGYVNEPTRRARFYRNFPLLLRDVKENPGRTLNKFLYLRDMAQSVQFEAEMNGGKMTPEMVDRCEQGIAAFEEVLDAEKPQLRMILDAIQYYSVCSGALGRGFDVEAQISAKTDAAPALATTLSVKGRFHNRATYEKVMSKIQQETTRHYESKHL